MITKSATPSWKEVTPAIAKVTFTEIIRDRVLYNVLCCAILLFGLGIIASRLTFIRPERVILDFGLSAVSLSCTMMGVLIGSGLIGKEFERRTVHVALSHPISKSQFVCGKFLGLSSVLAVNWFLLSLCYIGLLMLMQGGGPTFGNPALFPALFFALIQSIVMAGVTVLFSTFMTTSMAVVLSIGMYIVGENISELRAVIGQIDNSFLKGLLHLLVSIPPDLEYFTLGTRLTYGMSVSFLLAVKCVVYGALLVTVSLVAAGYLVDHKEV